MSKISVIIPTLNAEKEIRKLISVLQGQTIVPDEIIVIDSESDDATITECSKFNNVKVLSIKRIEFDHGGTRDFALRQSIGDFVLFITQDAIPQSSTYIENLIKPFEDETVAMTTGRQVARDNATLIERYTREFNYPTENNERTLVDLDRLGIKTFFVSDVCSAYRRSDYLDLGGFENPTIISEDMIIAAKFIYGNKKIAYVADAEVIHSHDYTLKQQFVRNFDTAAVMKMHNELFSNISAESEGIKMVKNIIYRLLKDGHIIQTIYYCMECCAKLLGNKLGSRYDKLSNQMIMKCTMNKNYWLKIGR